MANAAGSADGGIDLLVLETMSDLYEMETAVSVARELAPDLPIVAQMTFTRDDRTLLGHSPNVVAQRLGALDVDARRVGRQIAHDDRVELSNTRR